MEIAVAYSAWRSVFARLLLDPVGSTPTTQEERLERLRDIRHPQLRR